MSAKAMARKKLQNDAMNKVFAVQMLQANKNEDQQQESFNPNNNMPQHKLLYIIDAIMLLLQDIMVLGECINRSTRIQMLFIFFQAGCAIVFNSYNMVMFLVKITMNADLKLSIAMSSFYYGYQIVVAALNLLLTTFAFSMVYSSIQNTAKLANQLNLYVDDECLKMRVVSGTTTYIVILMQYGAAGETMPGINNSNGTNNQEMEWNNE